MDNKKRQGIMVLCATLFLLITGVALFYIMIGSIIEIYECAGILPCAVLALAWGVLCAAGIISFKKK